MSENFKRDVDATLDLLHKLKEGQGPKTRGLFMSNFIESVYSRAAYFYKVLRPPGPLVKKTAVAALFGSEAANSDFIVFKKAIEDGSAWEGIAPNIRKFFWMFDAAQQEFFEQAMRHHVKRRRTEMVALKDSAAASASSITAASSSSASSTSPALHLALPQGTCDKTTFGKSQSTNPKVLERDEIQQALAKLFKVGNS